MKPKDKQLTNEQLTNKLAFAKTLNDMTDGKYIMSDCEHYGMMSGCDTGCPVLLNGDCELQDADNAELYAEAMAEQDA